MTVVVMKRIGFEVVPDQYRKFPGQDISLPLIGTSMAAGNDVYSNETITVDPYEFHEFWLDIRAIMYEGIHAKMFLRSSMGRRGWRNALDVGIIDADYYGNEATGGNIMMKLQNMTNKPMTIERGDRIGQIIFESHIKANYGVQDPGTIRTGGYGSTN